MEKRTQPVAEIIQRTRRRLQELRVQLRAGRRCLVTLARFWLALIRAALRRLNEQPNRPTMPCWQRSLTLSCSEISWHSRMTLCRSLLGMHIGSSRKSNARSWLRWCLFGAACAYGWIRLKRSISSLSGRCSLSRPQGLLRSCGSAAADLLERMIGPLNREVLIVVGHTGYGKTLWTAAYARGIKRVLILERFSEKQEYGRDVVRFHDLRSLLVALQSKEANNEHFRYSYYPTLEEFEIVCEAVWCTGTMTLIGEEFDTYFRDRKVCWQCLEIMRRGRHREISLVEVTTNPYNLPIDCRREADRLIAFHLAEQRDRDWVVRFPGANKDLGEEIRLLDRLEFRQVERSGRILHGQVRIPNAKAKN